MAERAYTVEYDGVKNKVVKWTGLLNGDVGTWYPFAGRYPDKTMHVYGTIGTGGHVKVEGTNEVATPTSAVLLCDATEDVIDISSLPDLKVVLPNTQMVRPHVTAGDGTTSVTVMMELKAS